MNKKKRKAVDHRPAENFTLYDLRVAWDQALAGSTVGEHKIPVARSFESFSFRALETALQKIVKRKR